MSLTVVESLAPDNRELRQGEGSLACRDSLRESSFGRAGQRQGTGTRLRPGGHVVPDQYDWGLWSGSERYQLPHSYVYRRDVSLQAGTTYHFLTRNLQPLTYANPDPVMYLVRGNDIVAFNDDYTGNASEIIYTPPYRLDPGDDTVAFTDDSTDLGDEIISRPPVTDTYTLVIRAYATATPGLCDVYQGADGAPPVLLESNVPFAGTYVWVRWKLGEWFETGPPVLLEFGTSFNGGGSASGGAPDPYLFLITPEHAVGSKMYRNDDGAGFPNAKIEPPSGGTGTLILGAFSRYTGGECRLALVGESYTAPWMSPAPWSTVAEQVPPTPTATKYLEELKRRKPGLEKLSPDERDRGVLELQRSMLSEEEIRRQLPRMPSVSAELVRRQEIFTERCRQMERDLERMSYDERAAKLAHLKRVTLGKEYAVPEGPWSPESEFGGTRSA
jgi:hypothetical protein